MDREAVILYLINSMEGLALWEGMCARLHEGIEQETYSWAQEDFHSQQDYSLVA